jgi:hypothetical protein
LLLKMAPAPAGGVSLTLPGFKTKLLTTNGGLVHQSTLCLHEYGHSLRIVGFSLRTCSRSGTCSGCSALGAYFSLNAGGNCDSRCSSIKLEVAAGKIIVSAFILKKDNLAECLATPLKTYGNFYERCCPGDFTFFINSPFAVSSPDANAAFSNSRKNRITIGILKKGWTEGDFLKTSIVYV